MDFLKGKIRPICFRYLAAAFGSAMITSVYSVVDTAMVGQYHGPDGTAALAVVARGLVLSGILILILPALRREALWLAMPITETLTAVYAVMAMRSCTNDLPMEA